MFTKLPFHEWVIVALLVLTLLTLAFVTLVWRPVKAPQALDALQVSAQVIEVEIEGAVSRKGVYELNKGAKMKQLLSLAQPLPEADLREIKPNATLRDGQRIWIPVKEWITVHIEGAVEEAGPMLVLKGTTLEELSRELDFAPNADKAKLQKKRRLKDQEVVQVPQTWFKKKSEKKETNRL